jgi:hypothetical protein
MLKPTSRALATLVLVWSFCGGGASRGAIILLQATLSGPAEEPPNASPGTGFALLTLDTTGFTMQLEVTFSGLLGTTTASHIHATTTNPGSGTAGVATQTPTFTGFPLGVTAGSYSSVFDLNASSTYNPAFITANGGSVTNARDALLGALTTGRAYLNIHTSVVPAGEIRGFFAPVAVPEPSSLTLLTLGLATSGLAIARSRRKSETAQV